MNPIFFSNPYNTIDTKLKELIELYEYFRTVYVDYKDLRNVGRLIGKEYYKDAKEWFNAYKNATWYRDDLI